MEKPRPRMNAIVSMAQQVMDAIAQTLPERHRLGADMRFGVDRHIKTGPGQRTIHTLHRYINDPRRHDWSKGPRPR